MKPLTALITMDTIESLASRSNFRYGKALAEEGKIKIKKENTFNRIVEIQQGNKETRTVELSSTPKGFRWKCSCTGRKDLFCEHAAAACLDIIKPEII